MVEIAYWQIVLTALPLLAFIVNLSFGVFIFKRKRILVNRLFTLLMLSFCWWTIGDFGMRLATTKASAVLMLKFINIATPCIPAIALAFVLALENKVPSKRQLYLMVIGSLIFISLNIAGFLVTNTPDRNNAFGVYMIPKMQISVYNGYVYFTIYMMAFTSYVLYRLVRFYRTCDNELVKKRIRYMLIGAFITTAVTFITEFLIPLSILPVGFDIPSLGSFSTIFITSLTYYSVRSR
jgi:hypothetical protein